MYTVPARLLFPKTAVRMAAANVRKGVVRKHTAGSANHASDTTLQPALLSLSITGTPVRMHSTSRPSSAATRPAVAPARKDGATSSRTRIQRASSASSTTPISARAAATPLAHASSALAVPSPASSSSSSSSFSSSALSHSSTTLQLSSSSSSSFAAATPLPPTQALLSADLAPAASSSFHSLSSAPSHVSVANSNSASVTYSSSSFSSLSAESSSASSSTPPKDPARRPSLVDQVLAPSPSKQARVPRGPLHAARVTAITTENPHVKTITVSVRDTSFRFLPGQWSDFYFFADGNPANLSRENVQWAGFSMTSPPSQLEAEGTVTFAVKRTRHPVTQILHERTRIGDSLWVDGGHGDFYYSADRFAPDAPVVLFGGGIGVTPLMSILRHVHGLSQQGNGTSSPDLGVRVTFVNSVRSEADILFRKDVLAMTQVNPHLRAYWTITGEAAERTTNAAYLRRGSLQAAAHTHTSSVPSSSSSSSTSAGVQPHRATFLRGRIDAGLVQSLGVDLSAAVFFVCGPPEMVRGLVSTLLSLNVREGQIQYEKW